MFVPLFLLAATAAAAAVAMAEDTSEEYDQVVNLFYSVHLEPREWRTASDICREEGSSLTTFPSVPNRILLNYIRYKNHDSNRPIELDLWVNLEGQQQDTFLAANGSILGAAASQKLPFVCVRSGIECNTAETGYTAGPKGVSCYKFHEAPSMAISWLWAFTACEAEGAHLAIPDSDSELEFIDAYTKKRRGKYWMAIGVHEFSGDGVYRTLNGQVMPLKFQSSVNNQIGGRCVYITDSSHLHTFPCESGHASYLCEKDVVPRADVQPCSAKL